MRQPRSERAFPLPGKNQGAADTAALGQLIDVPPHRFAAPHMSRNGVRAGRPADPQ